MQEKDQEWMEVAYVKILKLDCKSPQRKTRLNATFEKMQLQFPTKCAWLYRRDGPEGMISPPLALHRSVNNQRCVFDSMRLDAKMMM